MAHDIAVATWPRPVISDQPDPRHVVEQADTYFGALFLAGFLAMSGLQVEMGLRHVYILMVRSCVMCE